MNWLRKFFIGTVDVPSPSDIVKEEGIGVTVDLVTINLTKLNIPFTEAPKVWVTSTPDTKSMDPGFDFGHNNILVAGADEADHKKLVDFLKVGDVAVYRIPPDYSLPAKSYAIHRIVEIGRDSEGRYFRFKGDNNYARDPPRVRDSEVLWLCIGTIF